MIGYFNINKTILTFIRNRGIKPLETVKLINLMVFHQ